MGKPVEGTVKPIVRTATVMHDGDQIGKGVPLKNIVCYAHCTIDGTLLSKYAGLWARNGMKCPKCGHMTWYVRKEWRNVPLVDESTFDIAQYVKPAKVESRSKEIADELYAADQAKQRAPDPEFQKSLLAKLTRIARALERLADAWEGGDHSIKAES